VIEPWQAAQFPERLRVMMLNREALFDEATPEQRASYRQQAAHLAVNLIDVIRQSKNSSRDPKNAFRFRTRTDFRGGQPP
jgi:hypothetical protein